jgi:cellulose synthase (UDP-forming)
VASAAQRLPSPPTDEERDLYFGRHIALLTTCGVLAMAGIVWATVHMVISHGGLYLYLVFVLVMAAFFLISLRVNAFTHDHRAADHRALVEGWRPPGDVWPRIDIWLPVAGEPLGVLENTWTHVSALDWDGPIAVYVGDDAGDPAVAELAERFGFQYLSRPDRGWMKKAGNLRHLYGHSNGEFVVVFDADFCPRLDFLHELMPYFEDDVGIVQSPQHFRVLSHQNWLERGAGAVQELFYRAVQVSRDSHGGAVCVGTNAIYRRRALDDNGGTTLIGHSEDVHTGFDLSRHGWHLRYVPVILATGLCPDEIHSFMRQQYRWCMGSMSLLGSDKFWDTPMRFVTRACYLSGFGYYISTALNAVLFPLLPIALLLRYPQMIHLRNYVVLLPAFAYAYIVFPAWHRCRWRLEAWSVQLVYSWSHFFALVDIVRRRPMGWAPTGARSANTRRAIAFRAALTWSALVATAWVGLALYRGRAHPADFLPIALLGGFYLAIVARTFAPTAHGGIRMRNKLLCLPVTTLVILAAPAALFAFAQNRLPVRTPVALGIIGTPNQFDSLSRQGMPLSSLAFWESWNARRPPDPLLQEARSIGAAPLINWQPQDASDPSSTTINPLTIAAGDLDPYIASWGKAIAAYGQPVYLRIAHEMNGTWYPWSHYGPVAYGAMWRHIHDVLRANGASNARLLWSPDGVVGHPQLRWQGEVTPWWPGRRYVDYVGMSMVGFRSSIKYGLGYFFRRLDFLHSKFRRPVILPEMKVCVGYRYRWLRNLASALARRPWVKMVLWSETPSTAQAAGQFRTGEMNWSLSTDPMARRLLIKAVNPDWTNDRVRGP